MKLEMIMIIVLVIALIVLSYKYYRRGNLSGELIASEEGKRILVASVNSLETKVRLLNESASKPMSYQPISADLVNGHLTFRHPGISGKNRIMDSTVYIKVVKGRLASAHMSKRKGRKHVKINVGILTLRK